jgi:hypothetical protein
MVVERKQSKPPISSTLSIDGLDTRLRRYSTIGVVFNPIISPPISLPLGTTRRGR